MNEDFVPEKFTLEYNRGYDDGRCGEDLPDNYEVEDQQGAWWERTGFFEGYKFYLKDLQGE